MAGGLNGAFNFRPRRPIRTHRVEGYSHEGADLAGFFHVEYFAAFIVPALGAGAMRHFLFVAVGAFR
jgi:hypothetical protein